MSDISTRIRTCNELYKQEPAHSQKNEGNDNAQDAHAHAHKELLTERAPGSDDRVGFGKCLVAKTTAKAED